MFHLWRKDDRHIPPVGFVDKTQYRASKNVLTYALESSSTHMTNKESMIQSL